MGEQADVVAPGSSSPSEGAPRPEAAEPSPTPSTAPSPVSAPSHLAWVEHDRLLLDGTVVLSVLTIVGLATVITGAVLLGTAGEDVPYCGGIETAPCHGAAKGRVGTLLLVSGFAVTVPSAAGLTVVASRLRRHRRGPRPELRLGPSSVVLRF